MKLKEIINHIESFAPLAYQENYDNAGLICGNEAMDVNAALICLDSTEAVINEAIEIGCNLIIAHHPIVFSGLKKITGKTYIERVIIKAIQHNIAIYAAHTNLDNVFDGVNKKIGEKLGLINLKLLQPQKHILKKIITYVPAAAIENVRTAIFKAGAGNIGNYDECSFSASGKGTFRAGEGTNPYIGEHGKRFEGEEIKLEAIYPVIRETAIVNALLAAHPYEEVAYDLLSLSNHSTKVGAGMIGELSSEMDVFDFLKEMKQKMNLSCIRYTSPPRKNIKKIAVCGGAGSFLLSEAIRQAADVFISADFKYHQFFDAEQKLVIADIGHFESEQYTIELFYEILKKKFSTFALHLTKINTNPIKYI